MLKRYKHEIILGVLICIYIAYFVTASFLRHDNFYTGRFDLGNMDQAVWNTVNGRIFQASNDVGLITSRLSGHADFILILLSPFYLLWSNPKTLLLIQTVILAFGAFFVFLIAKNILKNNNFALIFGFSYLMNPALQFTNLYDFHAVTLATTFLLASFYFLIKRKYLFMAISLTFSGITKEQIWVVTSIFGVPLLFEKAKKIKILGTIIIVGCLILFYYLVAIAIPQNINGQHFALTYYSEFGNSPAEVIKNVLLSPHKIVLTTLDTTRSDYLKQLFMPLGFISLLSPIYLIFAIPDLLINLLSNNGQLHQIYYQYSAAITPFIFISGIFGIKKIMKWFPKISKRYIYTYLIFFTFFSAYSSGPLPGAKNPNIDMFIKPYADKKIVQDFLLRIPERYTVAATNNLGAHLSHREVIYTIPIGVDKADFVVFLLNDRWAQPSLSAQKNMVNDLKSNKNYLKVFEQGNFIAFQKQKNL